MATKTSKTKKADLGVTKVTKTEVTEYDGLADDDNMKGDDPNADQTVDALADGDDAGGGMASELADGDSDDDDKPMTTQRTARNDVLGRAEQLLTRFAERERSLMNRIEKLEQREQRNAVKAMVEEAVACGKITPAEREDLIEFGTHSPKRLKSYLSKRTPSEIVSLGRERTPAQLGASGPVTVPQDAESAKILRLFGTEKLYSEAAKTGTLDRFASFEPMKLGQ